MLLAALIAVAPGALAVGRAGAALLRDFALPLPLFAPASAWRQSARGVAVAADSDAKILHLYRVLRGDTRTLRPRGLEPLGWPFADVNHDEFAIPIFAAGTGTWRIALRDYAGQPSWPGPSLAPRVFGGPVEVPRGAGPLRPAGPAGSDSDGHLVLYEQRQALEYDLWQASTAGPGGEVRGAGERGAALVAAGAVERFSVHGSATNPRGESSARATGIALLAGLLVPEDIERGRIDHALAFAAPVLRNRSPDPSEPLPGEAVYPAATTETDFYDVGPHGWRAGERIRLKEGLVDEDCVPIEEREAAPITRMFLAALREHGAYLVDNAAGFSFFAEDIHTAPLRLSRAAVNRLAGRPAEAPLPAGKTRWQVVMEALNAALEGLPLACGPWRDGQDPARAAITRANFEVIAPAREP